MLSKNFNISLHCLNVNLFVMIQFVIGNVKDLKIAQNLNVNSYVKNQIAFHNNNKINVAIVLQDKLELDL